MKTIHYLYISIFFFCCFFFLSIFIINGNTIFFDEPFYNWLNSFSLDNFFKFITDFGDKFWILIFCIVTFVLLKSRKKRELFTLTMIGEVGLNIILKYFFGRERPAFPHLVEASGYSFPSGHTMAAATFAFLIIYFIWESKIAKVWKILVTIFLIIYVLLIGLSRIYLGVHYTTDVLGALCISVSLVSFCLFLFRSLR